MSFRRSRIEKRQNVAQTVTLIVIGLSTLFYFANMFIDQVKSKQQAVRLAAESDRTLEELMHQRAEIEESNRRYQDLLKQLSSNIRKTPGGSFSSSELAVLKQDLNNVKSDLTGVRTSVDKLNDALGSNPEKAIALPLVKKDLEDLRNSTQRDLDALRGEMTRGYDLNKWLIGLILAAVLGTLINTRLQTRNVLPPYEFGKGEAGPRPGEGGTRPNDKVEPPLTPSNSPRI